MITTIPSQTNEMEKVQKAMVRDSLTRAFDELHSGKVHHDARKLFSTLPWREKVEYNSI